MQLASLDLDLEVFQGPFDLLLALVLREEVDLLEVDLAEIVLTYIDYLESTGNLDLEAATEFLVLIAALLELKSRLMLPREDEELDMPPEEAADELLARMLEYSRYRSAAARLRERLEMERGYWYRSAPLPPAVRRVSVELANASYNPEVLAKAVGALLRTPPKLDTGHVARPRVSVGERLSHLRMLLGRRGRFSFDDAVKGGDRLTEAVTLLALLELYKQGEAIWEQEAPLGPITITVADALADPPRAAAGASGAAAIAPVSGASGAARERRGAVRAARIRCRSRGHRRSASVPVPGSGHGRGPRGSLRCRAGRDRG